MKTWILEADIYRIEKAMREAGPDEKLRLRAHLRRAEARLVTVCLSDPNSPARPSPY